VSGDRTPPDLSPREAVERWLDRQQLDKANQTVADYGRRLRHFWRWCEGEGIETLDDLDGWSVEEYDTHRRARGLETITLRNELMTFRQFLRWAASRGLVDEHVPEAVDPPDVDPADRTDDTFLSPDLARDLLRKYRRGGEGQYGRGHTFLEIAWFTGARMGAVRGLDLDDVDLEEGYVEFVHRPDEATPLKNGRDGERVVGIDEDVVDAIRTYIQGSRPRVTDDYGRRPVFATAHGRVATSTLRNTCYYATVPCRVDSCPHDRERRSCEWYSQTTASTCPSSRSPHQVRSGSIMWQLNRGLRADVVAARVNASVDVIDRYYDKVSKLDEFRERREKHLDALGFDEEDETA
jgi:site-specific recombinase XerD